MKAYFLNLLPALLCQHRPCKILYVQHFKDRDLVITSSNIISIVKKVFNMSMITLSIKQGTVVSLEIKR